MSGRTATGKLAAFLFALLPIVVAAREPASAFFDAAGVKIHYLREGTGEPVLLIHGLYASAVTNWQLPGVMDAIGQDHDVVALDLPGHGSSGKPDDATAYGPQMAKDVVLLMDHLGIKKAHIVGYSLGGIVALKFIIDHPDRVLSGTLGGMGWLEDGGALQRKWASSRSLRPFSTPTVCVQSVGRLASAAQEVKVVKTPMEIIVGERDPTRRLYIEPLQVIRPDWPIVLIPNAGHINCVGQPLFQSELERWLDANRQK